MRKITSIIFIFLKGEDKACCKIQMGDKFRENPDGSGLLQDNNAPHP